MEFVTTFGFPSWKTIEHPCPLCWCTRRDWDRIAGLSPLSLPWASKTWADYVSACRSCERWVVVATLAQLYRLRAALFYDKRKGTHASRGRALRVALPELQLLAGDRLEPHPSMPDVGVIDHCTVPIELLFWRPSCESMTRHRNPLFDEDLGITPEETFVPDWLHCFSLGVYQRIISWVWHKLFEMNVFDVSSWRISLLLILSSLFVRLARQTFATNRSVDIVYGHISHVAIYGEHHGHDMAIYDSPYIQAMWPYIAIIWREIWPKPISFCPSARPEDAY